MTPAPNLPREVLFEFRPAGNQIRVAAIDVTSGLEVIIIAPLHTSQEQMKSVALAKLRRRLDQLGDKA
jgi:hypothetical protein